MGAYSSLLLGDVSEGERAVCALGKASKGQALLTWPDGPYPDHAGLQPNIFMVLHIGQAIRNVRCVNMTRIFPALFFSAVVLPYMATFTSFIGLIANIIEKVTSVLLHFCVVHTDRVGEVLYGESEMVNVTVHEWFL